MKDGTHDFWLEVQSPEAPIPLWATKRTQEFEAEYIGGELISVTCPAGDGEIACWNKAAFARYLDASSVDRVSIADLPRLITEQQREAV